MQYASEQAGVMTSVHQWKPIPPDRFATLLHFYSTVVADEYGHEAISTTALALDSDATATIYYRRKERGHSVSSPVLMSMEGVAGKVLCFETTNPAFAKDPATPASVVAEARFAIESDRCEHLKRVAKLATAEEPWVIVLAPSEAGLKQIRGRSDIGTSNVRYVLTTNLGEVRRDGAIKGVWLHNAGNIGPGALGAVMDQIADIMGGRGWMAMTGSRPMGWPAPDGLPKKRI